ncbi:MAG TPA: shikimate kinase [Syntrophales bacterium]
MNIILIGYRASGKTSAGRELAKLLGRPFFDTDRMIFAKTGRTIREIVEAGGWQAFREVEKTVISELSGLDEAVIALGGGAVMDRDNVTMLGKRGRYVWLQADARIIALRMGKEKDGTVHRPSLTGAGTLSEIEEVLAKRLPVYRAVADIVVDTAGKDLAGIAAEIAGRLEDDLTDAEKKRKRRRPHVQ